MESSNYEINSGIQLLQTLYCFTVHHVPTPAGKGTYMKVKKHLTLDDRICIQQGLSEQRSFKAIAEDSASSRDCQNKGVLRPLLRISPKTVPLFQRRSVTIWSSKRPALLPDLSMTAATAGTVLTTGMSVPSVRKTVRETNAACAAADA